MSTGKTYSTKYLQDSKNNRGSEGQILSSTSSGIDWVTLSDISGVDGTGATNYLSKWLDANTIGNSVVYDDGTNVGVGISSPNGNGSKTTLHINSDTNGAAIRLSQAGNSALIRYDDTDGLQVGTIASKKLSFETGDTMAITIDTSQNVGIGIVVPSQKLDVSGKIAVDGQTAVYIPLGDFTGSSFYGDGGGSLSYVSGNDGRYNTGVGIGALSANTTGYRNVASGYQSLYKNTIGRNNIASGYQSLFENTSGNNNIASGYQSLYSNISGEHNIASGYQSLYENISGGDNIAIGYRSLHLNTTGDYNIASGRESLYSNTIGSHNVASGYRSLYLNTEGSYNVASGYHALRANTEGDHNIASGYESLYANTLGSRNIAIGYRSLFVNTEGIDNIAIGYHALRYNTLGNYNVASGRESLFANTTGANNTAIGRRSLYSNTTGGQNIAIGFQSGRYIANGSTANQTSGTSVYIGGYTKALADGGANEIVIGYGAIGNGSNTVTLGNTSVATTILQGKVGIGATNPNNLLNLSKNVADGDVAVYIQNFNSVVGSTNETTSLKFAHGNDNTLGYEAAKIVGGKEGDFESNTSNVKGFLSFSTASGTSLTNSVNNIERMRITGAGNVGIGTTSPTSKLDIYDTFTKTNTNPNTVEVFHSGNVSTNGIYPVAGLFTQRVSGGANSYATGLVGVADKRGDYGYIAKGVQGIAKLSGNITVNNSDMQYMGVEGRIEMEGSNSVNLDDRAYSFYGTAEIDSGSHLKEYHGLYLNTPTNNGTILNKYGISQVDANSINYFAGNVGIGTPNPQAALDLGNATNGTALVWGGASGTAHYNSIWSEYSSASLVLGSGLKPSTSSVDFIFPFTGTYGYAAIELDSFSDDGIKFYTAADAARTAGSVATKQERVRIDTAGNVGIGTANPIADLHVNGDVQIGSSVSPNAYGALQVNQTSNVDEEGIAILSASAGRSMRIWVDETKSYINSGNGGSGDLILNEGTGNVGIGAANPATKLHVVGRARFDDTQINAKGVYADYFSSGQSLTLNSGGSASILFKIGSTTALTLDSSTNATFAGNIILPDANPSNNTGTLKLGTGADLQLYHNGFHSYIDGTTTGDLYIRSTNDDVVIQGADDVFIYTQGGQDAIIARGGGTVELYHSNSKKLETTSTGVSVNSDTEGDTYLRAGTGGVRRLDFTTFSAVSDHAGHKIDATSSNGVIALATGGTERLRISSAGAIKFNNYGAGTFTGTVTQKLGVDSSGNVIEMPIGAGPVDGSGTANYLARWIDSDTLGIGVAFDNGTNVGIGTFGPAYKLDVNGDARSTHFRDGLKGTGTTSTTAGWYKIASWANSSARGGSEIKLSTTGGSFTPVTWIIRCYKNWSTSATLKLEQYGDTVFLTKARIIEDTSTNVVYLEVYQSGTTALLFSMYQTSLMGYDPNVTIITGTLAAGTTAGTVRTELPFTASGTSVEELYINDNVGIGTTNPSGLLHVSSGTSGDAVVIIESDTDNNDENDNPQLQFKQDGGATIAKAGLAGNAGTIFTNSLANAAYFGNDEAASLQLYTNATARLTIESGGNVGIGTTNPSYKLEVNGDVDINNGSLLVQQAYGINLGVSGYDIVMPTATRIAIKTSAAERLTILNDGNVGLSNVAPLYPLDIKKPSNTNSDTIINLRANWANTSSGKKIGSVLFTAYDVDVNSGGYYETAKIGARAANEWTSSANVNTDIFFETINAGNLDSSMVIKHDGNIGIGTDSPSYKLQVRSVDANDDVAYIHHDNASQTSGTVLKVRSDAGNSSGYSLLDVQNNSVNALYVRGDGKVGIGTNSPTSILEVLQTVANGDGAQLRVINDGTAIGSNQTASLVLGRNFGERNWKLTSSSTADYGTNPDLIFTTTKDSVENLERLRITNAGNVGIGTDDPYHLLDLYKSTGTTSTTTGTTLQRLWNYVGGDLQQQKTFIDFVFQDDNDNQYPQVRIGAEVGQNGNSDTTEKEGSGAFVVYTNNAPNSTSGTNALAERFRVDYAGNVGIGTNSPSANLHIQGSSATDVPIIRVGGFGNSGSTLELAETLTNGNMNYGFSFFNDGNSSNTLQIKRHNNSSAGVTIVSFNRTDNNVSFAGGLTIALKATSSSTLSTDGGTTLATKNYVDSQVGASDTLQEVTDNGNTTTNSVGIGTTNPLGLLQVGKYTVASQGNQGTSGNISSFANSDTNNIFLGLKNGSYPNRGFAFRTVAVGVNSDFTIYEHGQGSAEVFRITSLGNVGIGTPSPIDPLNVQSTGSNEYAFRVFRSTSATQGLGGFYEGGANQGQLWLLKGDNSAGVMVNSNGNSYFNGGNVGIGIGSPSYKLQVNGGVQAGGKVTYENYASTLNTTGYAVAGLTSNLDGASAGFTFTCFGHSGGYQRIVYSCHNDSFTWNTQKVIDEGTNDFDVTASANGSTITFTFKSKSGTKNYTPRVVVEATGDSINNTYA